MDHFKQRTNYSLDITMIMTEDWQFQRVRLSCTQIVLGQEPMNLKASSYDLQSKTIYKDLPRSSIRLFKSINHWHVVFTVVNQLLYAPNVRFKIVNIPWMYLVECVGWLSLVECHWLNIIGWMSLVECHCWMCWSNVLVECNPCHSWHDKQKIKKKFLIFFICKFNLKLLDKNIPLSNKTNFNWHF